MMTRRRFVAAAAALPVAAASDWEPVPVWQQFLPMASLPRPQAPRGLGVGAPWQDPQPVAQMLARLQPSWWYDWRFEQCGAPGYVPMIWSDTIWSSRMRELESLFVRRPDVFWLLWNEPERADQANMHADEAARITTGISGNYGIEYAAPGVALTTDGYNWLHDYMAADAPIPHMWHVHIYRTDEPDEWRDAWGAWVDWMTHHNVVRPTIVSETNGWTGTAYSQRAVMRAAGEMMADDDLLQAIGWFSTRYNGWGAGQPHLLNHDGTLTEVGEEFAAWQSHSRH